MAYNFERKERKLTKRGRFLLILRSFSWKELTNVYCQKRFRSNQIRKMRGPVDLISILRVTSPAKCQKAVKLPSGLNCLKLAISVFELRMLNSKQMLNKKVYRWLVSNHGVLVSEATALLTEPQQLSRTRSYKHFTS